MDKSCFSCKHHELFIEEDGTEDGCVCWNKDDKHHINNCYEYCSSKEFKGCPYWKEREC